MRPVNDTFNDSGVFRNARDGYLHALGTVRAAALRHRLPLWNYFSASGCYESKAKDIHGVSADPTEAEMRWEIFSSLAYGARGILVSAAAPFASSFEEAQRKRLHSGSTTRRRTKRVTAFPRGPAS